MEKNQGNEVHEANYKYCNGGAEISEVVEQPCGDVVISIKEMLKQLPEVKTNCNIFRVPKLLRQLNNVAYIPQVISIGPFHLARNQDLIATERYKLCGLRNFLRRIDREKSLEDLVEIARSWVEKARNCYAESIKMSDEKFATMLLVDGCFMVEFFLVCNRRNPERPSLYQGIIPDVYFDLIKLENQLPFFVLQHLFDQIPVHQRTKAPLLDLALEFLVLGWEENYNLNRFQLQFDTSESQPQHLVHILNNCYNRGVCDENIENKKNNNFLSFFRIRLSGLWNKKQDEKKNEEKLWIPPSITELWEAGVTIKKIENESQSKTNMISFQNGVFVILPLVIDAYFETIIRNLIAYEHLIYGRRKNTSSLSYVLYLDSLISTEKDVRLLVNAGILTNDIGGNNEEVARLFNNLGKIVTGSGDAKVYLRRFNCVSKKLCEHRRRWWNKSKASLKHNYFNTPWAVVSFFAATFLILLTVLQTIFSAVSTFH